MWDSRVSQTNRFLLPAAIGLGFGLLEIGADRLTGMTKVFMEAYDVKIFHIGFPASALIYPAGAVIVDTLYRLIPIPLVMALVLGTIWLFRRLRGQPSHISDSTSDITFWVVAGLLSWFEPVTQSGVLSLILGRPFRLGGHEDIVVYEMVSGYAFNLAQAYLFRRFGFLACLTTRVCTYLVWHVIWGYLTQAMPV
jgi:hypothetical protein